MTDTPIFEQLTADAVEACMAASRRARSVPGWARHSIRADQIRTGACPPWRTNPAVPPGFDGVTFR